METASWASGTKTGNHYEMFFQALTSSLDYNTFDINLKATGT